MSEIIDKTIDAVKTVTTEPVMKIVNQRLSNPFFLCFISSWILCNWERVLILLFAFGQGVEQRIEKIKLIPSNSVFFGYSIPHAHTFWYPFLAAVFFVVGYPFVSLIVDVIQNGVIKKKNTNDSLRKQSEFDSQMEVIAKKVQYEHSEEQERLKAKKETKQIELDTTAIERKHAEQVQKLQDIEKQLKDREQDLDRYGKQYDKAMNLISEVRGELDSKKEELNTINGDIIKNQNILDSIKKEISSKVMPGTLLTGLTGLSAKSSDSGTLLGGGGRGTEMINELGLNISTAKSESKAPILKNAMNLYPDRNKKE